MPGLNRKGPEGLGPRTGRGLGHCKDKAGEEEDRTQETEERPGRGMDHRRGFGHGGGRGRNRGFGRGGGRGRNRGFGRGRSGNREGEDV